MTDPQTRKNVFRASLWMIGTLISFTAMAVSVRELSDHMSTFQLLFFRSVVGLIVISILLFRSGWVQIQSKQLGLQILRNIVHYGGQFGWFVGISRFYLGGHVLLGAKGYGCSVCSSFVLV